MPLICPQIKETYLHWWQFYWDSLMFLEPFDWDYVTSITFAVSQIFSYFWIFLKGKGSCFVCIPPSIPSWKCWRRTMFQHEELLGAMYGQKLVLFLKKVFNLLYSPPQWLNISYEENLPFYIRPGGTVTCWLASCGLGMTQGHICKASGSMRPK